MQEDARRSGDLAHLSGCDPACNQLVRVEQTRVDLVPTQDFVKPPCLRCDDMSPCNRSAEESGKRGDHYEPTPVDDHDVVDGLGDLGENVARHEHCPALRRELAEKLSKPMHTLRVESVRWFVENQQLGVSEKRCSQP